MIKPNKYRDNTTATLNSGSVGKTVRVAGWVENIRDHGGIMFIDLRDHYGSVQITVQNESLLENVRREASVGISGKVVRRAPETFNPKIGTGEIEIVAETLDILGQVYENLPFEPSASKETNEETRLKYRFLDLRNKAVHDAVVLRSKLISFMRKQMDALGFLEMQTPILTASSPEGARDFLIPSRKHRGKFYALPQAPQIFKQLLMVSGFDRYYQIAPCFRDEDARADRTAGEFYQLDLEMAYATQDDVFDAGEAVISAAIEKFGGKNAFDNPAPFPRITFKEALLKYGTDKPDLRNPLFIIDVSDIFADSDFKPFAGKTVRAVRVPGMGVRSKTFFKNMEDFALSIGMKGLGYVKVDGDGAYLGPIDKFLTDGAREEIRARAGLKPDDALYFIADGSETRAAKFAGEIRAEVAARLGIIKKDGFAACWITDFPFYEEGDGGKPQFGHNPFSMPQGELDALNNKNPFDILAHQYDFVLNGTELASGAVRNHNAEVMVKAFEIAGFSEEDVKAKFGALYSAFKFGAPPHAGMAFGIDRLLMILSGEENVREVIAFPLNSNAQDVLLGAPGEASETQLRETHIKIR
ncbi:MAG: aspartate--tRNA ligase [Oscillospiraceae bacterium]|jgi:aspartyl-tRNA synthetase|nr:aspartate--tRNA ligase [Oscillospiraceae bacterium]